MASSSDDGLPFSQYTSATAVHTTLLAFTVLFLPRAALLWEPTKHSSTDKPQHEFLDALTASPISTVAWMCIGVAFIQVSWGGWVRSWYIANVLRSEGGAGERDGDERLRRVKLQKQRFKYLKGACLATLVGSFAFHVVLVLLGAPLTNCSTPYLSGPECPSDNLHIRTYLLALLLSLLTVPAAAYTIGIPSFSKGDTQTILIRFLWIRLFGELSTRNSLERVLVYPVIGVLVGSWLGAIPIALDWDRPWQAWPLTPAYGAVAGYIVATLVAFTIAVIHLMAKVHISAQVVPETRPSKKKSKSS
ncbi:hypothetical protein AX14_004733 [Amanita brunnescens Koide BX004]|nr:hypothetical protein AX14_007571 [Amanita brunnescens Koide BX004]KAF8731533.1 hypothetical protein AX14_004733 [Amanita brunnescens Koide BX004]